MHPDQPSDSRDPSRTGEPAPRGAYGKPTLTIVPLRPDEAVLGGCKTAGSGGAGGSTCTTFGVCRDLVS